MDINWQEYSDDKLARIAVGYERDEFVGGTAAMQELHRRGYDGVEELHYNADALKRHGVEPPPSAARSYRANL